VETMHLTLATPDYSTDEQEPPPEKSSMDKNRSSGSNAPDFFDSKMAGSSSASSGSSSSGQEDLNPLLHSPGLILWPSTFIPMPPAEVEAHSLKHNRVLLSCKAALSEYAAEISDENEVDDEGMMEAMWDYENFLQQRFNPPPGTNTDSPSASSSSVIDDDNDDRLTIGGARSHRSRADNMSVSSVTTESQSAMWDYQFELRHHFAWPLDEGGSAKSPSRSQEQTSAATNTAFRQESPITQDRNVRPSPPPSISTVLPSFQSTRAVSIAPPNYSRFEPTHVRTFHVYEAIKMDESVFGAAH